MTNNLNSNKVVIFDINFFNLWCKSNNEEILKSNLQKVANVQNLIICTNDSLKELLDFCHDIQLSRGYAIASSGSVLYDFETKKNVQEICFNANSLQTIIHNAYSLDVEYIVANTINEKIFFIVNYVKRESLIKLIKNKYMVCSNFYDFERKCLERKITSIDCFFSHNTLERALMFLTNYFDPMIWRDLVHFVVDKVENCIHFTSREHLTKLETFTKINQELNIWKNHDCLYICWNEIDEEMYHWYDVTLVNQKLCDLNGLKKCDINDKRVFNQSDTGSSSFGFLLNEFL